MTEDPSFLLATGHGPVSFPIGTLYALARWVHAQRLTQGQG